MRIDPFAIRSAYQAQARFDEAATGPRADASREKRLEQRIESQLTGELARIRERIERPDAETPAGDPGHLLDILA
jgi:hypothetical protein